MTVLNLEAFAGIGNGAGMAAAGYTGTLNGSIIQGRYASGNAYVFQTGDIFLKAAPTYAGALIFGAAVKMGRLTNGDTASCWIRFLNASGTAVCGFGSDNTGRPALYVNNVPSIAPTAILAINQFNYFEIKYENSGLVTLRVNGVALLSITGGGSPIVTMQYGFPFSGETMTVCDVYQADTSGSVNNDFLGDTQLIIRAPTSDSTPLQWTPSTPGAHFSLLDEAAANGDIDYIESNTAGQIDRFASNVSIGTPQKVHAIAVRAFGRKTDTALRQFVNQVSSSGSVADGSTKTMNASFQPFDDVFNIDPSTSAPWTNAAASAALFGVKTIA